MASQRRNRTQADADKAGKTRVLNAVRGSKQGFSALQLPAQYRRFLQVLEAEGQIRFTIDGWVAVDPNTK